MLSRTGSLSGCMVSSWMSTPLGSFSGVLHCQGWWLLVVSPSMILLWVDVLDDVICLSDGVSGVLHEPDCLCSSCVWWSCECTASVVSTVTCCCFCCGSSVVSGHHAGGCSLVLQTLF